MDKSTKKVLFIALVLSIVISTSIGTMMGYILARNVFSNFEQDNTVVDSGRREVNEQKIVTVKEETAVIEAVERTSPAVVSIIVTKDLPIIERYYDNSTRGSLFDQFFGNNFFNYRTPKYIQRGTETIEVGGGTGFVVTSDGYIVTNKHVVEDEDAGYTVLMNDDTKYKATVLARDTVTDFAVLKIEPTEEKKEFKYVTLGDSSDLKVGQSVIAIGNSLGEYSNTVSTGVISGLSRSITAGGNGVSSEELVGLIQTDASINPGNSGGPLLNLSGQVIGINTAMAASAENIGFALPINEVKNIIDTVKKYGRIVRPWLGIRYVMINESVKKQYELPVAYGALLISAEDGSSPAVVKGSPAEKAGLKSGDVILEVDSLKVDADNPLYKIILNKKVGDEIKVKIIREGQEKETLLILEEVD